MTPSERAAYLYDCKRQRFAVPSSVTRHFNAKLKHRAFVSLAAVLMQRMVAHASNGQPGIPVEYLPVCIDLAGVSRSRSYDALADLRARGWLTVSDGFLIFDFRTEKQGDLCPTIGQRIRGIKKPSGKGCNPSEPPAPVLLPDAFQACAPSGGDESPQKPEKPQEAPQAIPEPQVEAEPMEASGSLPAPSVVGAVVAELVSAGADRAGAVTAARAARKAGRLSLENVRAIIAAVDAMPSKPYRRGGLLCAAVSRPELGRKLVRDAEWQARKQGTVKPSSVPQEPSKAGSAPIAPPKPRSPWESAVELVKGWRSLVAEPDDLRFMLSRNPSVTHDAVRVAVPEWGEWL